MLSSRGSGDFFLTLPWSTRVDGLLFPPGVAPDSLLIHTRVHRAARIDASLSIGHLALLTKSTEASPSTRTSHPMSIQGAIPTLAISGTADLGSHCHGDPVKDASSLQTGSSGCGGSRTGTILTPSVLACLAPTCLLCAPSLGKSGQSGRRSTTLPFFPKRVPSVLDLGGLFPIWQR